MILAADLGSTNLKAAIFSGDGRRAGEASLPMPYSIRTPDQSELSPDEVWETFRNVASAAIREAGITPGEIECATFTSQAQTFCVCDAGGRPCGPLIGWTDQRAREEAVALHKLLGVEFHGQTGWPDVQPGHLLSKVLWWKSHHGLPPDQRIVSLPSFLAMRLGAPLVIDCNLAAMTGLFSIPHGRWWNVALAATGIEAVQLGKVPATGEHVAILSGRGGDFLPSLRSVVMAGNDHTAGAVGCGCSASRSVLTLGTAGVFYRFAGIEPGPYSKDGLWGPYPGGGGYELRFIPHACSALDWADGFLFGSVDSPRFVERAKLAAPDCEGIRFQPEKWGSMEAWTRGGSPEAMARAVLEGITESLHTLVAPLLECREDGSRQEIVLLGGGSRLDYWVEMISNRVGCPLWRAGADGLDGAARLAAGNNWSEK